MTGSSEHIDSCLKDFLASEKPLPPIRLYALPSQSTLIVRSNGSRITTVEVRLPRPGKSARPD